MIEEIAASDQRRLKALSEAAEEVALAQDALEVEKAALQDARDELDVSYAEMEAKRQESAELIQELLEKADELESLYEGFELEEEALMAELAAKEKEYNEAKRDEWLAHMATYTTVPPETTRAPETTAAPKETESESTDGSEATEATEATEAPTEAPTEPAAAVWLVPCSYVKLTSPFGNRESPTAGASSYHQGVDLAGPEGTPIYAARTGIVTTASYSGSAGYYVTINHGDGYSSIYMHMTGHVVSSGQAVSAGQLIGYMGSTGISTGPHLHFGISLNGVYVNPALYVPLY